MNLKLKLAFSAVILILTNGCATYSAEDYEDPNASTKESLCINMEPAQEMKCKEREKSLLIGLGADKNCNHPYEYGRNRCRSEQARQKKALDESLKKHTDK
ncbi:hypothetical protein SG34_032135 [Thalassomonas viridans]|uniref:Lipoprotein n=1 Tax=Thalassomonas viridans TaxID=137584 RepID=A0AAE9Z9G4_9GAMM|nr:hypothetical protein [Thalassomonas viridans]WDE08574.1 hypothetical protein SG34_032135 [Thalassomonas viridans]